MLRIGNNTSERERRKPKVKDKKLQDDRQAPIQVKGRKQDMQLEAARQGYKLN